MAFDEPIYVGVVSDGMIFIGDTLYTDGMLRIKCELLVYGLLFFDCKLFAAFVASS